MSRSLAGPNHRLGFRGVRVRVWQVAASLLVGLIAPVENGRAEPVATGVFTEWAETPAAALTEDRLPAAPIAAPNPVWVLRLPQRDLHAPVPTGDGRLLVAGDGGVASIDAGSGALLWYAAVGAVAHPPLLLPGEDSLIALAAGGLVRLDGSGAVSARFDVARSWARPCWLPDQVLAVAGADGAVEGFGLSDVRLFRRALGPVERGAHMGLACGGSDGLLVGVGASFAHFGPAGTLRTLRRFPVPLVAGPVASVAGLTHVLLEDGALLRVDGRGRVRARAKLDQRMGPTALAARADGGVCLPVPWRSLVCFDGAGRVLYRAALDGASGPPVVAAGDVTLAISGRGTLYAFEADGRVRFTQAVQAVGTPQPVLDALGTVYVAGGDGQVSAWR